MMRLILVASLAASGCVHCSVPRQFSASSQPVMRPIEQVSQADRAAIESQLPPSKPLYSRTMTKIDKVDDDWLIQSGVTPGDVAVSDILKHGGGTIWVFRKVSDRWKQITTWGEIY